MRSFQTFCGQRARDRQRSLGATIWAIARALLVLAVVLYPSAATPQERIDAAQNRKAGLEIQKITLEIEKLDREIAELKTHESGAEQMPVWLKVLFGFLGGIATTAASVWAARRARLGALDQSVHEKRLESYPGLVGAAAPLAVYFPPAASTESIAPRDCAVMGRTMSQWYLDGGGLLLSVEARDAYFRLARALTRASLAETLSVPRFPAHADSISVEKLEEYRKELAGKRERHDKSVLDDVEKWAFGGLIADGDPHHIKFKDYVFLQRLSSTLRTTLSKDLRSRRRPS
jgi:hypothetical protein